MSRKIDRTVQLVIMLLYTGGINTMEQKSEAKSKDTKKSAPTQETHKSEESSVSIGDSTIIAINDRQIMIKKLGLIKYTIMTRSVKELITTSIDLARKLINEGTLNLVELDETIPVEERSAKLTKVLSEIVETNIMQVIKLIDICVPDLGYDYICEEVGVNDALYILKTVVAVNKLQKFGEDVKNLLRGLQVVK